MLLRNYFKMLYYMTINNSYELIRNAPTELLVRDINGDYRSITNGCRDMGFLFTNNRFYFGDGTAPVSYDDYRMDHQIAGLASSLPTFGSPSIENGLLKMTYGTVISNRGSSDVTLAEIGIYSDTRVISTGSSTTNAYILVYREVFNTPIIIAPRESVQYTLTLLYNSEEIFRA